jgi:hypothetical protein
MITMKFELEPFNIPDMVYLKNRAPGLRQDGMKPLDGILLMDLDPDVIEALCDDFKARIMESYKKHSILTGAR